MASTAAAPVALTLPRPDDWHLHLRDGAAMEAVVAQLPRTMARAIVMPNLRPPVRTGAEAQASRARILAALPRRASSSLSRRPGSDSNQVSMRRNEIDIGGGSLIGPEMSSSRVTQRASSSSSPASGSLSGAASPMKPTISDEGKGQGWEA